MVAASWANSYSSNREGMEVRMKINNLPMPIKNVVPLVFVIAAFFGEIFNLSASSHAFYVIAIIWSIENVK